VAWRLGKADIPRDNALKDLRTEETAKIRRNLLGECRPVVIHREKNAFDFEGRVDGPAKAHERVEELRNALDRQVLALNRDEERVGGGERIQSQ
jgi:hypothetical protein